MKFFIVLILMAALSFSLGLFFPWWTLAPACFLVALLLRLKPLSAFIAGFIAIFLLWGWLSYWISSGNDHQLAGKVAMLILKKQDAGQLILVTSFIGGLVGGLGGLCGSLVRRPIPKATQFQP